MKDPYTDIASAMFNVPERKVTEVQRKLAKTVAFGAIYSNRGSMDTINTLVNRRRRARRQQRWAIALLIIGAALLLALEAWKNAP